LGIGNLKEKIAVIAYTTFSTDTRVQKEAYAAYEAGYDLDIYTLEDKNVSDYSKFNFIRSNIIQYKGQSKFQYVFSYVKFFFYCLFYLSIKTFTKRYKFIHVHNMPNFLVFSTIIQKLFGSKIILDIHDLMPEIFSVKFRLSIDHWFIKALYFEERRSAICANEIIATNKFHVERFKKNRINSKITEVINVADEKIFYAPNNKDYSEEKLVIAYPSTLAKRLGIDNLIEAVETLFKKGLNLELNIYGDGEYRDEILEIINQKGLNDVVHLSKSFISLEKLSMELDKTHIGVIPLPSDVSNDIAMPVKIYEFFAKKVCVVATELPLLYNCFNNSVIFFKESNSLELAEKLEDLYKNRQIIEDYANRGYEKFSSQTWDYYKSKYQELLK